MKLSQLLSDKNEFTIGFLGGSITEGAGSSSIDKCYASLVCKGLQEKYPNVKINCVNAGVGGTGSSLGLFRLKNEILVYNPDLVFVEFAVNDAGLENTGIYMENILRQIKTYNKNTYVVFLYTIMESILLPYEHGDYPQSVEKQMRICKNYGIAEINVGYELYKYAKERKLNFLDFFNDGVHPKDEGYFRYAETILSYLEDYDFKQEDIPKSFVYGKDLGKCNFIYAKELVNETWKLSHNNMYGRLPNYMYAYTPGDELQFIFRGTFIGMYYTVEKDSGDIEYSIDSGKWKQFSTWDKYALNSNRATFAILDDTLEDMTHTMIIKISENKNKQSEGHYIRIGAFGVCNQLK